MFFLNIHWGFLGSSADKESACNAGDQSLIPRTGSSPGEGVGYPLHYSWASLVAQTVKNLPAMQETRARSLGWKDPLEEGMATHSSILAWRIPWTEEPGRLQSMSLQTVGHTWVTNHSHSLLQGIFLIQASNLGLLHCRRILYHLSHQGSWLSHSNKRRTCYTALFPFLMKKGLCLIEMHK